MVEAELFIGHLRSRVRDLESLLSYLESRSPVEQDDYAYSQACLRNLIKGLRELERFSSRRGAAHALGGVWLN